MRKLAVRPRLQTRLQEVAVHPFVFAVFPVLSLYVENVGKGFFREAIGIAVSVVIFAALLWLFVNFLIKDRSRSATIVSVFLVLFFSYGHVTSAFDATPSSPTLDRMQPINRTGFFAGDRSGPLLWLAIWAILLATASYFVVKLPGDFRLVTKFLNIVALTLMVLVGVNLATVGVKVLLMPRLRVAARPGADTDQSSVLSPTIDTSRGDEDDFDLAEFENSWQQDASLKDTNAIPASFPDIYYIIVDAYARADILEDVYRFDNSEFLSYLAETGFYVAHRSRANYPQSALSLSSSLNFMYLDGLADQMGPDTDNRQPLQVMIKNNKLVQYLRARGYSVFAFSSGYGFTELTDADIYAAPHTLWNLSEFQEALVTLTPLSIFRKTWFDIRRDRVTYAFDHIVDAAQVDGPTFTFVHVLVPHWPFIFDADGTPIQPPKGIGMRTEYEYDEFIEGYRNQLTFVNKRLRIAIDGILLRSSAPPIIILQADHGPDAKLDFGWDIQNTYLPERLSIFNAYYFPDQNYEALYEDITPVNTFRVMLNNYFGTDYELLEDRSYFASWDHPYSFVDVTDEVSVDN